MAKELAPALAGGPPVDNPVGLDLRRTGPDLLVCVSGVGKVNAALATQFLIDRCGVSQIWNAGVAGCFEPLEVGTLVCAQACVQHDLDVFGDPPGQIPVLEQVFLPCAGAAQAEAQLCRAGLPCRIGVVATGDWFGRDPRRTGQIQSRFGALVCDMEAGAMAQVCLRSGVPFHCLKVVSDHLSNPAQYQEYQHNLPAAVARLGCGLELLLEE